MFSQAYPDKSVIMLSERLDMIIDRLDMIIDRVDMIIEKYWPQSTHISISSFCGTSANSAETDQTPQNTASDQLLHCLLTEVSFKN